MGNPASAQAQDSSLGDLTDLFREHRSALFAFALNLARNPQVAADVCQQTWLRLLEIDRDGRCPPLSGGALHAYLTRTARNVYIDHYVRSHDACRVDRADNGRLERVAGAGAAEQGVEQVVELDQLRRMLVDALGALPEPQMQVLCLWASGVTPTAVARRARVPRDTILSRKKYGVAKLRRMLLARGLTAELATVG